MNVLDTSVVLGEIEIGTVPFDNEMASSTAAL
jgi:hypothetical protein